MRAMQVAMTSLTLIATLAVPATELRAQTYVVTDIGSLDGNNSVAWQLNDRGEVVGWSTQSDPPATDEGVFWSGESGLVGIGQIPGLLDSFGIGINDAGTVVAYGGRSFEDSLAFVWTAEDGSTLLPTLGGDDTQTSDINDVGQITGFSKIPSGFTRAFIVEDGEITDLGVPAGAENSDGNDLNNRGEVMVNAGSVAYIWQDGNFIELPNLFDDPTSFSRGNRINDLGTAVGTSTSVPDGLRGVIWENGSVRDLGVIDQSDPFGITTANSINNRGDVVGRSTSFGQSTGFICEEGCPDGVLTNLNELLPAGTIVSDVFAINNAGQILILGAQPPLNLQRGLLLTPVNPFPVLINPAPGVAGELNRFDLLHLSPNAEVAIVGGRDVGTFDVPGCAGAEFEIDNPRLLGFATAGEDGSASFEINIPSGLEGDVVYFQAVDLDACEVTAITAHRL